MNTITVKINGLEYNLKGEECQEYLQQVATYVDNKMQDLMDNNEKLSVSAAAVLTALNSVDERFKIEGIYNELLQKTKDIQKNEELLKDQIQYLKKQITHLEEYNSELQNRLSSSSDQKEIEKHEQVIENLNDQISILEESAKSYLADRNKYKAENKELKFQIHSAKYKIINLENKLLESQIGLAKAKKKMKVSVEKSS